MPSLIDRLPEIKCKKCFGKPPADRPCSVCGAIQNGKEKKANIDEAGTRGEAPIKKTPKWVPFLGVVIFTLIVFIIVYIYLKLGAPSFFGTLGKLLYR